MNAEVSMIRPLYRSAVLSPASLFKSLSNYSHCFVAGVRRLAVAAADEEGAVEQQKVPERVRIDDLEQTTKATLVGSMLVRFLRQPACLFCKLLATRA